MQQGEGIIITYLVAMPHFGTFLVRGQKEKKVFQITETKLKLDAVGCLLHVSDLPIKKYKHLLSMHLLNAAKALIPLYWKSTHIPTIQDWLRKVSEVCEMEETIVQSGDNTERFHNKWSPWFIYKYSQAYIDLMNIN